MNKIEFVENAIYLAEQRHSRLTTESINTPFLGSLQIRHLLNNLGSDCERYLECGCHKGGSFCSTIFSNNNIRWGVVVDSFESDRTEGETAEHQFLANFLKFKPLNIELRLFRTDCFKAPLDKMVAPFDLYLYDAGHEENQQARALTYYLPVLADEFVYCCDDYSWEDVRKGTQRGIKEANLEILYERELVTNHPGDNESWFNGFYVAILKKKT